MSSANAALTRATTAEDIETWMTRYLGKLLDVSPDEIGLEEEFTTLGLDSSSTVGITGDLGDWLGVKLDETLLYNYPTISDVSKHIVTLL